MVLGEFLVNKQHCLSRIQLNHLFDVKGDLSFKLLVKLEILP